MLGETAMIRNILFMIVWITISACVSCIALPIIFILLLLKIITKPFHKSIVK